MVWTIKLLSLLGLLVAVSAFVTVVSAVDVGENQQRHTAMDVKLPIGAVNVVVLTDVHSWVGGHNNKKEVNSQKKKWCDYGHVLSFYQRLKLHCELQHHDLWFVMNGDWIDGTGIAMNGDPSYLIPILQKMPWDAINIGNHELYRNDVIDYMLRPDGFVEWEGRKFLSSNVAKPGSLNPVANNFRLLHGRNSTVLAFGFLYNMDDNADHVNVKTVESVLEEGWFQSALKDEKYDSVLVLAHMGADDDLVSAILAKIRQTVGEGMPVQFVAGHTHNRQYARLDNASTAFEAGKYLDTLGFVSFPTTELYQSTPAHNRSELFKHTYINASVEDLKEAIGVDKLYTEDGEDLSRLIAQTRRELGLNEKVGCVAQTYYVNRSLQDPAGLWKFFEDNIAPTQFGQNDVVFMDSGNWRYDLLSGDLTVDDLVIVSPFNHTFVGWQTVDSRIIRQINETMNEDENGGAKLPVHPLLPKYVLTPAVQPYRDYNASYNLIVPEYMESQIQDQLANLNATGMHPKIRLKKASTDIWIDFFRDQKRCFRSSGYRSRTRGGSKGGVSNPFAGVPPEQLDNLRIGLGVAAVVVVLALVTVYVRQRGLIFQSMVDHRETATLNALSEVEEEEGEFV